MKSNNIRKTYKHYDNAFTTFGFDPYDNALYCITDRGFLLKINCTDYMAEYIIPKLGQEYLRGFVACNSVFEQGKMFFFSYYGNKYLIYDIKANTVCERTIKDIKPVSALEKSNVLDLISYGGYIFGFIRNASAIVKINAITGEVVRVFPSTFSFSDACAVWFQGKEFLIFENNRIARVFDYVSEKFTDKDIGIEFPGLQSLYTDKQYIYMLSHDGDIVKCNLDKSSEEICLNGEKNEFSIIIKCLDALWAFPALGDDIYCIEGGKITCFDNYSGDFRYCAEKEWFSIGAKYVNYVETEEYFYFPARISNRLILLDKKKGIFYFKEILSRNKFVLIDFLLKDINLLREGDLEISLNDYINVVK